MFVLRELAVCFGEPVPGNHVLIPPGHGEPAEIEVRGQVTLSQENTLCYYFISFFLYFFLYSFIFLPLSVSTKKYPKLWSQGEIKREGYKHITRDYFWCLGFLFYMRF